jgi:hypothetical protein
MAKTRTPDRVPTQDAPSQDGPQFPSASERA